jgi:hypothetical protein
MPTSARFAAIGLGTAFVLFLLFVSLRSTSTPLHLAAGDRLAAQRTCRGAVRERLPDARFPHGANVEARDRGKLRLFGSVDAGSASEAVRRNYECVLLPDGSGGFVADSVRVWQSH